MILSSCSLIAFYWRWMHLNEYDAVIVLDDCKIPQSCAAKRIWEIKNNLTKSHSSRAPTHVLARSIWDNWQQQVSWYSIQIYLFVIRIHNMNTKSNDLSAHRIIYIRVLFHKSCRPSGERSWNVDEFRCRTLTAANAASFCPGNRLYIYTWAGCQKISRPIIIIYSI